MLSDIIKSYLIRIGSGKEKAAERLIYLLNVKRLSMVQLIQAIEYFDQDNDDIMRINVWLMLSEDEQAQCLQNLFPGGSFIPRSIR